LNSAFRDVHVFPHHSSSFFILIPSRCPCSFLPLRKDYFLPLFPIISADIYYIPASFPLFRASSFAPIPYDHSFLFDYVLSSLSCLISHTFLSNIRFVNDHFDYINEWTRHCFNDLHALIIVPLSLLSSLIRFPSAMHISTLHHHRHLQLLAIILLRTLLSKFLAHFREENYFLAEIDAIFVTS